MEQDDAQPGQAELDGNPETGVPVVDEVLRSLQGLEGRAVGEHVAVFEHAHERLRRALDAVNDPSGG